MIETRDMWFEYNLMRDEVRVDDRRKMTSELGPLNYSPSTNFIIDSQERDKGPPTAITSHSPMIMFESEISGEPLRQFGNFPLRSAVPHSFIEV